MYTIKKEFSFCASHTLCDLADGHPCARMHGHNYVVILELQSKTLNQAGFVKDYRELDIIKNFIDNTFDHKHLNDVVTYNPSAENLARGLYDVFKLYVPELSAVTVCETPKTSARYEPDNN